MGEKVSDAHVGISLRRVPVGHITKPEGLMCDNRLQDARRGRLKAERGRRLEKGVPAQGNQRLLMDVPNMAVTTLSRPIGEELVEILEGGRPPRGVD